MHDDEIGGGMEHLGVKDAVVAFRGDGPGNGVNRLHSKRRPINAKAERRSAGLEPPDGGTHIPGNDPKFHLGGEYSTSS